MSGNFKKFAVWDTRLNSEKKKLRQNYDNQAQDKARDFGVLGERKKEG